MSRSADDLRFGSLAALRQGRSGGDGEAEALIEACLAAMAADAGHPTPLNAIRWINPQATEQARAAAGPLGGAPIMLKDNIDLVGAPTTSGALALGAAMPRRSAGLVDRLRAAGAVTLAKTNLSEFSFEIRSRSSLGGDVRNPFDRTVTAGGSSGGAAAAVAAGFAVAAIGTDTGGSIRIPAAYNGLVGLRPTHGLIDAAGVAPLAPSTDTVGTLTRSVADAALLLACLTGRPTIDLGPPPGGGLTGIRVGVFRQAFGDDPQVAAAADVSLDRLSDLGATVIDPVAVADDLLRFDGAHIVDWEFGPAFDHYLATNFASGAPASLAAILESGDFLPEYRETLDRRAMARDPDGAIRRSILADHQALANAVDGLCRTFHLDALIYPTSRVVPASLGNPAGGWAPELAARTGRPAISLPVAQAATGVPIGMELLGAHGGEDALLALAAALERALDVRFRRPPA